LPREIFGQTDFYNYSKYEYVFLNHLYNNEKICNNLWNHKIFGNYLSDPEWIFMHENAKYIQNNSRLIFDNLSNTFVYDQYFSSEVSLIFLDFCYRNFICRNLSVLLEFLDFSARSLGFSNKSLELFLFKFNKVNFYLDASRIVKSNNFYISNKVDNLNFYSRDVINKYHVNTGLCIYPEYLKLRYDKRFYDIAKFNSPFYGKSKKSVENIIKSQN